MGSATKTPNVSWPKQLLFWLLLVLLVIGTLELATRVCFAALIGRSVLFYGTSFERVAVDGSQERSALLITLRQRTMRGAGDRNHSVRRAKNQRAGYYKYHPDQQRSTYDVDTGEVYPVTINSRGFRGREFAIAKPPGVIRIVTLGASSTLGYHNRDDLTYPAQLERRLQERCPGVRYEVINLGIPHLTTAQILALFLAEGVQLEPDVVTFYEGWNDAGATDSGDDAPAGDIVGHARSPRKQAVRWLRGHFLVMALGDALMAQWTKRYGPEFVTPHIEARRRGFLAKLSELEAICREQGFELILMSQQSRSLAVLREDLRGVRQRDEAQLVAQKLERDGWVSKKELGFLTHAALMQDEARWAREQQIPFVDALGALDLQRDQVVSWVHLSHEANRVVAELLAEEMLTRTCPALREASERAGVTKPGGADAAPGSHAPPPARPDRDPSGSGGPAS